MSLLMLGDAEAPEQPPRLVVTARPDRDSVELEFVASTDHDNLEDQLAYLSEDIRLPEANELSLRLLRHQASSVSHRKYYGIDIITVIVERSR